MFVRRTAALAAFALFTIAAVPHHVETWANYRSFATGEGRSSPASTLRRWGTYIESTNNPFGAPPSVAVCNVPGHPCNSVVYVDDSIQYFGTCGWSDAVVRGGLKADGTLAESSWLHGSHVQRISERIHNVYGTPKCAAAPDTNYVLNHKSVRGRANPRDWMNAFYQREWGANVPDYYIEDDIGIVNVFSGRRAAEYTGWRDMLRAQADWLGRTVTRYGRPQPLFFNGCSRNPYVISGVQLVKMRPNIAGCENEDGVNSKDIANGRDVVMLDNCARVSLSRSGGIFVNGPDEEGGMQARRQATAFNWLCYVPGRVVEWEQEEWGSKWANLFPEEGVYVTNPLQSMRLPSSCPDDAIPPDGPGNDGSSGAPCAHGGHNDLLVAGATDVFRREFDRCYNQGAAIGRCAVIWNMSGSSVTIRRHWLSRAYAHAMTMRGGTIDEDGSITLTAGIHPAGSAIPAYDAVFLFQ